jgi:antirestriction protein
MTTTEKPVAVSLRPGVFTPGHYKVRCPRCQTIWTQCRCPAKDKVEFVRLCPACEKT